MESGASVQLVEEHGWTIVSRSKDGELETAEKALETLDGDGGASTANTKQGCEEDLAQIKAEQTEAGQDCKMELEQEEIPVKGEVIKQKDIQEQDKKHENVQKEEEQAENDELDEGEEGLEEEEEQEEKGGGEDDEDQGRGREEDEDDDDGDSDEEAEHDQDILQRACADGKVVCAEDPGKATVDGKQMLVQKHQACFLWRVSLMVVLGFFGWAVLTVDGGGGRAGMNLSGTPFLQLLIS